MKLLQVLLAAGLLASLAWAGPLPTSYDDDDYNYDDEYYYDEDTPEESVVEQEQEQGPGGSPEEPTHHHHNHNHDHQHSNEHDHSIGDGDMSGNELGSGDEAVVLKAEIGREKQQSLPPRTVPEEIRGETVEKVAHGIIPGAKLPNEGSEEAAALSSASAKKSDDDNNTSGGKAEEGEGETRSMSEEAEENHEERGMLQSVENLSKEEFMSAGGGEVPLAEEAANQIKELDSQPETDNLAASMLPVGDLSSSEEGNVPISGGAEGEYKAVESEQETDELTAEASSVQNIVNEVVVSNEENIVPTVKESTEGETESIVTGELKSDQLGPERQPIYISIEQDLSSIENHSLPLFGNGTKGHGEASQALEDVEIGVYSTIPLSVLGNLSRDVPQPSPVISLPNATNTDLVSPGNILGDRVLHENGYLNNIENEFNPSPTIETGDAVVDRHPIAFSVYEDNATEVDVTVNDSSANDILPIFPVFPIAILRPRTSNTTTTASDKGDEEEEEEGITAVEENLATDLFRNRTRAIPLKDISNASISTTTSQITTTTSTTTAFTTTNTTTAGAIPQFTPNTITTRPITISIPNTATTRAATTTIANPDPRDQTPVPVAPPVTRLKPQNIKSCTQPPDPGVCRGSFPKFYYDPASRACLQFVYGGCRGNANVFQTAQECYEKCDPVGFTRTGGKAKDDYLTLQNGRGKTEFTFPGTDAAILVKNSTLNDFSVRNVYQLEFTFRTDAPHGLLAFLRQTSVPPEVGDKRIQLYVFIRRGHLGVTHLFCHNSETFIMKKGGLQAGNWHSSMVKVDPGTGKLLLEVDGTQQTFTITSLVDEPHYGALNKEEQNVTYTDFSSRLWIGGVFEEDERREEIVGRTPNFHGCMRKVGLMSGETSDRMVRVKGLKSDRHRGVTERCSTHCKDRYRNMCSSELACVEHFDHSTCSCFGTGKDGRRCEVAEVPTLSLRNEGHVVHRIYEWMDRVHTYTNFISMDFRTRFTDSILFYASSQYPERQYIAGTLTVRGTVYIEANMGGGPMGIEVGEDLNTGTWHTLTILHQHNRLQVHLNSRIHEIIMPGEVRYFHLNPDFYFGNAPNLERTCGLRADRGTQEGFSCQGGDMRFYYDVYMADCYTFNYTGCGGNGNNYPDYQTCVDTCRLPGLRSMHSYLGCMRNIFINDVSVLWELKEGNKTTRYVGPTKEAPFVDTCNDRDQMVLLTLSTERAHVNVTNHNPQSFKLAVSFRPTKSRGVVASGNVDVLDVRKQWEIHHDDKHVSFVIHNPTVTLRPRTRITIGNWQYVEVTYSNKKLYMKLNQNSISENPPAFLTFHPSVSLGLGTQEYPGMVGCVRKLQLGGEAVDLRSLVGTNIAHRDAIYDGCRVLAPCERRDACEHGTPCTVGNDDQIQCNCTSSGYTGKTCHFSMYKSSCEDYRHLGYETSGVYKIDVDGNGQLPPAYVRCEFNPLTGVTSTIVENNLKEKYEVRRRGLGDIKVDVEYRDFDDELLKALVKKEKTCTQKATYYCRRSPLMLSTHTWFSSPSDNYVTSFGSRTPGLCRCREINACEKTDIACNCDAMDGLQRSDVAVFRDPKMLPLTSMVFRAHSGAQEEESDGRITLGPLTCDREAIAESAVSFSAEDSYLEVPAWREGSLAFSFKTTSSKAVIAFQPAYHPEHASFRIALLGEREVEFMYTFHGLEHRHVLNTVRRLNNGEWQQILLDTHLNQLSFLVNSERKLIDVDEDANLGVLDGSLFLGGAPDNLGAWQSPITDADRLPSLRGCIRDLKVNNELLDFERYVRAAPAGVRNSCVTSCNPNPCQNGAQCIESWGSYECVCKNDLAHSGKHCERNPNVDGITFTTEESKLKYFVNETSDSLWTNTILNSSSLLLNFRTHENQGLILFTYDYLHNFLQLYLASPTRLVLLFNSGNDALTLPLETSGGVVLNGGQSVQVSLKRTSQSTTLKLHTEGVTYAATSDFGLNPLQDEDYEQFPFGDRRPLADMVSYPHSFTRPRQFYITYLGSADDSQWDVRSDIPGFVGCIRGLQVNSSPLSLSRLLDQFPAEGVKKKCVMVCDSKPCLNGGVCRENFLYSDSFYCDCTGTSFTGPVCSSETAYTFHGSEWLSRSSSVSPIEEGVVLEFAFSASTRLTKPQIVALLRSTMPDHPLDYILVYVDPDGDVGLSAVIESIEPFTEFVAWASLGEGVNAYSGLRHMVRVEVTIDGLNVMVDKKELLVTRESMAATRSLLHPTPRALYLGGLEDGLDDRFSNYDNFHGCISNVAVSHPEGKVFPLHEYREHDLHITKFGQPGLGSCSGFPAAPILVMAYHNRTDLKTVKGEPWMYREAMRVNYEAPEPLEEPVRDTAMDNVVPLVSGLILLFAAIVVGLLCLKHKSYKKKKDKKTMEDEEQERKRKAVILERQKQEEEARKAKSKEDTALELAPLLPSPNGGTKDIIMKVSEKQTEAPLEDLPPPPSPPSQTPTPAPSEISVEVRSSKDAPPDRPLSWDKSADTLPLIIGTEQQVKQQQETEEGTGDSSSSSDGSSFEYTLDITAPPPSSEQDFPPPPPPHN